VETALVARLVADAAAQPAVLPLVSHALLETWRQRRGTTLTLAAYEAVGGIQHAIARTAEALYSRLDTDQQTTAHQIFLRLIAFGDGTEDTRRRVRRTELDDNPNTVVVLEKLAHARLITLGRDSVELVHEALIRHWPRLRDWLTDGRDGHRIHRELTEATDSWESHHRDPEALYRGARLARAETWAAGAGSTLSTREREFLHVSLSARASEHAAVTRRTRRLRRLAALLAVLVLLATGTTIYAVRVQHTATEQRNRAIAHSVVSRAAVLRASNPALAAQLALAAYRLAPTRDTRDGLISAVVDVLPPQVHSPAFRPDGRLLTLASDDATIRLSEIHYGPQQRHLERQIGVLGDHGRNIDATAYTQDRRLLAIGRDNSTIRLWDISTPYRPIELATLAGATAPVPCNSIALGGSVTVLRPDCSNLMFSPDGRTLVSAGTHTEARLWDVSNPRQPRELTTLRTSGGNIYAVAFSPDGHTLATVSVDGSVRLWDISNPHDPGELTTLPDQGLDFRSQEFFPLSNTVVYGTDVSPVAFSPHGQVLAFASTDNTIRLWDVTSPRQPLILTTLAGHTTAVYAMEFSPDGDTLATAGADNTIRLWDVTNPRQPIESATLSVHPGLVYEVTFSPDGSALATFSIDRNNLLWQTTSERAAARACDLSRGTTITQAEWDQYFPGLDYQPPCP
jgi:WD40 repeat protein